MTLQVSTHTCYSESLGRAAEAGGAGREQASRPGTFSVALSPDLWQDPVLVFPRDAPVCPPPN